MSSELVIGVYASIFGTIVSVFGISVAAVIALTQVLQPVISHAQAWRLLKSRTVILAGLSMILSAGLCIVAIVGLAYPHDMLPMDMGLNGVLSSLWFLAVLIFLIFFSVVMTIKIIYQQSSLLIPQNALKHFKDNLDMKQVSKYFIYKGSTRPFPPMNKYLAVFADEDEGKMSDEGRRKEEEEESKKYREELANYERLQAECEHLENPLIPLESYLTAHIKKGDLFSFVATLKTFESIISGLVADNNCKYLDQVIAYYCKALERMSENAVVNGALSFMFEAVESSHRVALTLIKREPALTTSIQAYWENTAQDSMGVYPLVFKRIMEAYRECGELILKVDKSTKRESYPPMEDIFRSLGRLGEKYLESRAPERKTIMQDSRGTEFDSLVDAVLSFGWLYSNSNTETSYPLIYFDTLYVIGRKLIEYYKPSNESDSYASDISNTLFSLMYEHLSYGEAACLAKNNNGARLSVLGLRHFIKIFESSEYGDDLKKHTLDAVLKLGAAAYVNDVKPGKNYSLGPVQDYVLEVLRDHSDGVDLSKEGFEIYIKSSGDNMDKTNEYLKIVGPILGTNFNLKLE